VLVVVVTSLVTIVAVEVVLRRFAPIADPYEVFKNSLPNEYIRSQFRPNYRFRTEAETGLPGVERHNLFTTNNVGFRGDTLVMPKPATELRVFMVGGSTTECLYLDDSKAINRILQDELNRRMPAGAVAKVYNAGKSGDRSDDHVSMIVHRIIHMNPDLIIVFAGVNDLSAAIAKADSFHMKNSQEKRFTFSELLRMAATEFQIPRRMFYAGKKLFFKKDAHDVLEEIKSRSDYRDKVKFISKFPVSSQRPAADPTAFRDNLKTIAGVAKSHGVELVFMTQQTTWNSAVDPRVKDWQWMLYRAGTRYRPEMLDEAMERFNDVTGNVALENSVPVYDIVKTIPKSLDFFYDDVHFNINGAHEAAVGLASFLADHNLLNARGTQQTSHPSEAPRREPIRAQAFERQIH